MAALGADLSGQRRTIRVFQCPIAAMPKPYRFSFSSSFRHDPFYRRKSLRREIPALVLPALSAGAVVVKDKENIAPP